MKGFFAPHPGKKGATRNVADFENVEENPKISRIDNWPEDWKGDDSNMDDMLVRNLEFLETRLEGEGHDAGRTVR